MIFGLKTNRILFRCLSVLLEAKIQQRLLRRVESGEEAKLTRIESLVTRRNVLLGYIITSALFTLLIGILTSFSQSNIESY